MVVALQASVPCDLLEPIVVLLPHLILRNINYLTPKNHPIYAHASKKSGTGVANLQLKCEVNGAFATCSDASPVCRTIKFNALSATKQSVATRGNKITDFEVISRSRTRPSGRLWNHGGGPVRIVAEMWQNPIDAKRRGPAVTSITWVGCGRDMDKKR